MNPYLLPLLLLTGTLQAAPIPPVVYTGSATATTAADGGLRPVVGVHNIQVYRANRTRSEHADGLTHTYTHQPMLAYAHGRFHLEYLSAPRNEHDEDTVTSLTSSVDGLKWSAPRVVFPAIRLPDGSMTIAHQRMGFYRSPNDRLLLLNFYGKHPTPNDGSGLGRAVREIYPDNSLGPIHFIRVNQPGAFPGMKPPYPFYHESPDKGFIEACDALLANKLMTAQWWEEEQADESGFFRVKGKALSFVRRPDGSVLGIWKNSLVATTTDSGQTWTEKVFGGNLPNNASKYWLQRTGDSGYALFLNPTNRLRHPLAVMTSPDSATFDQLWSVHGELPDQRFGGGFKNLGPQYVRGIVEGNGTPPDGATATWITYSVNKEDIWIARVPVPLTATVAESGPIEEDFQGTPAGRLPGGWNIYHPLWAPVRVIETRGPAGHALELRDADPYDYARAVRVFPATHGVKVSFRVLARQANARLEIDLLDAHGARPVRLAFAEDGRIWACHEGQWMDAGPYVAGNWHELVLEIPASPTADRCALTVDGVSPLSRPAIFTDPVESVERLSFRTGAFRDRGWGGRDLAGADQAVPEASFVVDDISITPIAMSKP